MKRHTWQTILAGAAWLLCASAGAQTPVSDPDYVWNAMQGEKLMALRAKGDASNRALPAAARLASALLPRSGACAA